jgi:hypothetical protein
VRPNPDERARQFERESTTGDARAAARVLVNRMRSGTFERWRLNMLRVLDYPPAGELVSYAEIHSMFPMRRRGLDTLVFVTQNLVPREQQAAVYRVAGTAQVSLLEGLVYRPILAHGQSHAPTPLGDVYTHLPFEILDSFRQADGAPDRSCSRALVLGGAAGELHSYDFGGELAMNYYLNALSELASLMYRAPLHPDAIYASLLDMLRDTADQALDTHRICVEQDWEPKLDRLVAAIKSVVVEQRPGLWGSPEIDIFLSDLGMVPAVTRWLLR